MRGEWLWLGVVLLSACARTGAMSVGEQGSGGAEGNGGAAGYAGAGGADNCVVTCCDGMQLSTTRTTAKECRQRSGFACAEMGGPELAVFEGETVWAGDGTCPTMRSCVVNCCNGQKVTLQDQFDREMCAELGSEVSACAGKGGPVKVLLGGKAVFQGADCPGRCQTNCCDGTVAFSDAASQSACEMWAGDVCAKQQGGPAMVAHDDVMVWNSGGQCPSLRSCLLRCLDGAEQIGEEYQESVCMEGCLGGGFCDAHQGAGVVEFDGKTVWTAP